MTPVTDPELLKKLEGGDAGPKPVTDPAILEQLEGKNKPAPAVQPDKGGGFWSSAADFFKSIPQGIVRGATGAASALGQAEEGQMTGGSQQTVPGAEESAKLAGVEKLPQPQGAAGRFGGAIGSAIGNPASYMGPPGVRTAISALGGALGGQTGAELFPGSKAAPIIGGAIGGLAGGTRINPEIPPASRQVIRDAAETAYDTIKYSPRQIPAQDASVLADNLRNKLNAEGVYREAPEGIAVFKTLDRLNNGVNANHILPDEVHSITKTLQKIASSNPGNATGRAAGLARSEIFDYLKQFPELREAIEVGNANWRALKTSEKVVEAQEKGQFGARATITGDNIDQALRSQIRQMYFNNKVYKSPEEKALMQSIVEGDTASNIVRNLRKVKTPIKHMATAIIHAKGAGTLTHMAELLARGVANRNTAKQVEKLDEAVRWGAPASGARPVPAAQLSRGAQRARQVARGAAVGGVAGKKDKARVYEE